ncbi:TVP38/TMEM64 family protein [Halalkalibacterium ligniniphilum]|uniref:TVP38/TMEM64 family protein n=1 Tax=Halalkalibacterium ligniniphilum TaxID=1134413 RepID=UPI00034CD36D|nr:TVP38/TMEM64 family protein [Halalkalibacterium ligniniphilum]
MAKKLIVLLSYILIAFLIYLYGESLLTWIQEGGNQYVIATALVATLLALFPIIPYPIIGGVLGAVFGPTLGSIVTWTGSSLASILMFAFVRYGYQDWGLKVIHRYKALSRVTELFERNAFITIFLTRLIPFIPSIVVNIYSALSRVSFLNYTIASSLGKMPSMILFAVVGNSIVQNPQQLFWIALFYGSFLLVVWFGYRLWGRQPAQNTKLP